MSSEDDYRQDRMSLLQDNLESQTGLGSRLVKLSGSFIPIHKPHPSTPHPTTTRPTTTTMTTTRSSSTTPYYHNYHHHGNNTGIARIELALKVAINTLHDRFNKSLIDIDIFIKAQISIIIQLQVKIDLEIKNKFLIGEASIDDKTAIAHNSIIHKIKEAEIQLLKLLDKILIDIDIRINKIIIDLELKEKNIIIAIDIKIKISIDLIEKREKELLRDLTNKLDQTYNEYISDINAGKKKINDLIENGLEKLSKLIKLCSKCHGDDNPHQTHRLI